MANKNNDRYMPKGSITAFSLLKMKPLSGYSARLHSELFGDPQSVFGFNIIENQAAPSLKRTVTPQPCAFLNTQLSDDFHTSLIDWSSRNVLAIGHANSLELWNANTKKYKKLFAMAQRNPEDCTIRSVSWSPEATLIAVGTNLGTVQIWDVNSCKKLRTLQGHHSRVGALAWNSNVLTSGGLHILHHDMRTRDTIRKQTGHKSEICSLRWSYDSTRLASGGNKCVNIWNNHSDQPIAVFKEHTAAVKAIAWSPHEYDLIASGGGTDDKTLRIWNTTTAKSSRCIATGSQVCNLAWSNKINELISTHGFGEVDGANGNEVNFWSYPSMSKVATLKEHKSRVLHLAISPDARTLATGDSNQLRLWDLFP